MLGTAVGISDCTCEGEALFTTNGARVGAWVPLVGVQEGVVVEEADVTTVVGDLDGSIDGNTEGNIEGCTDGVILGTTATLG
jgi:hypothetical protein